MRVRLVAGVVTCFVVVGVVLPVVLFGPDLLLSGGQARDLPLSQASALPAGNAIMRENTYPGTSSWQIPPAKASSTQIQAYANATSVSPGERLTFYVSTQKEGTGYFLDIYRLGWYRGYGGRLMTSQRDLVGHLQGYFNQVTHSLVDCNSCHIDAKFGLIEANWKPSYLLTVPPDWTTGVYLAKFTDANGMQTYVPFDVRGNFSSRYVVVTPDTTYAAYNDWGGGSLYQSENGLYREDASLGRDVKVSFDRPYTQEEGSSQVLVFEADAIHWLERLGYDLSYISNVDLHENPSQLLAHRAYISLGHDEYWTKEMRDGVEHARDSGIGLAFLGANAAYWQMRFEPDSAGNRDRTIVCYKVETDHNDLARDPLYGADNSRVTSLWRDPVLDRPENALVGIMFSGLTGQPLGFPWLLSSQIHSRLLDGTGLQPGQPYGCDLVGYEWDRVFANSVSPAGLQVLSTSPTINIDHTPDASNTTYYIASSGAMVFATGSIYWALSLDAYRFQLDNSCPQQNLVVPSMQTLMANVMNALGVHHSSRQL